MSLFSRRGFLAKTAMVGLLTNALKNKSVHASAYDRGLNQPLPKFHNSSNPDTTKVNIRYLGTAGFIIEGDRHTSVSYTHLTLPTTPYV